VELSNKKTVNLYTQGSKKLGLGHLSRIVPIYHYLKKDGIFVNVFLYGDELGHAYLEYHSVDFLNVNDYRSSEHRQDVWLIDSTDIYEDWLLREIEIAKAKILLSPKFDEKKVQIFSKALLRADPFNLKIMNKVIDSNFIIFNDGGFKKLKSKKVLAIALSGGDASTNIHKLLETILSNHALVQLISRIKVFLGGSDILKIPRPSKFSYDVDLIFISSLGSLWEMTDDVDLFLVGNGIIVDECISKRTNFVLINWDRNNKKVKSQGLSAQNDIISSSERDLPEMMVKLLSTKGKSKHFIRSSKNDFFDILSDSIYI
jgi:spore coat polysaccharide biosynthesis predicted glycosyltransferase SpsG